MSLTSEQDFSLRLNQVEATLKHVDSKVDKIYDAVIGNEEFDQQGIIGRIKKVENDVESVKSNVKSEYDSVKTEIDSIKAFRNKLIGAAVVGSVAWTIILEAVKIIIEKAK